ncbi:hypothetical protein LTR53_019120, partial [Teratosphaeriaceae sp. CCFEE 6253]
MIEDAASGEHHHPTVHYVFADDDPDHLTSSILAAIDQGAQTSGTRSETEERVLVLDMDASGKQVVKAVSLSPLWQALKIEVGLAPSWGGAARGADAGLMLQVSGRELVKSASKQHRKDAGSTEDLMTLFNERLEGLGSV